MVFSSIIFLFFFFPLILASYYLVPRNYKNLLLLLVSLVFYFWGEGKYVSVMLFYMVFNYYGAVQIEKLRDTGRLTASSCLFIATLSVNLGVLIYFKYIAFLIENIDKIFLLFNRQIPVPSVHLPIGISFFSFQAISYIVDVYRGDVKAQNSFINFSMYKAFFPQLIAGPIVRYRDIARQVVSRDHSMEKFAVGLKRFVLGLGKKVLIANNVAITADAMFKSAPQDLSTGYAWLGVVCYMLQIYFDFSGYSDMAIGLAKMFGFDFLENFNYPYISHSIKEFWRRWHISLSTWFRDYVYISLGGNRYGGLRTYFNLFIVFLLCGAWHGAQWTFVIWGIWHGFFLILERTYWGRLLARIPKPLSIMYTLLIVLFGWIFFRADSIDQAVAIIKIMIIPTTGSLTLSEIDRASLYAVVAGVIGATPFMPRMMLKVKESCNNYVFFLLQFTEASWVISVFLLSITFLADSTYNPFIYFRF